MLFLRQMWSRNLLIGWWMNVSNLLFSRVLILVVVSKLSDSHLHLYCIWNPCSCFWVWFPLCYIVPGYIVYCWFIYGSWPGINVRTCMDHAVWVEQVRPVGWLKQFDTTAAQKWMHTENVNHSEHASSSCRAVLRNGKNTNEACFAVSWGPQGRLVN